MFTDTALQGTVDLFEVETGVPDGTAVVDASLVSTGSFTNTFRARGVRISETVEEFDVTGTVDVGGTTYVLQDCFAVAFEGKEHYGSPQGPKGGGGGRVPANDLPEDAVLLEVPSSTTVRTGAASPAPEAACSFVIEDEGEPFEVEVPLGNTVWYAFEGTGEPVTVDTSGTEFDTVAAIYDADLQQLACVDDVESGSFGSLQAAVTVDTALGETYLVQVGGFGYFEEEGEVFPADSGRLRITVR